MKTIKLLFFVRRAGPYHHARFEAAGREMNLVVVETRPESNEYPWTVTGSASSYTLLKFQNAANAEDGLRGGLLASEIEKVLQAHRPQVVATSGWADPEYHAILKRCHALRIPAVVMSDSTYDDEPRSWWKEQIKCSLLAGYGAALVAGTRSREYLLALGFAGASIFQPWDVVDNHYFQVESDRIRFENTIAGEQLTPEQTFLCVARLIPKKNIEGLITAYAAYVGEAGKGAWKLVISGSGPLEGPLRAQVASAGLVDRVEFCGFKQYPDLPKYYAGAGVLLLPSWSDQWGLVVNEAMASGLPVVVSTRCGCAPDLVRDGENGFVFDPRVHGALKDCLLRISRLSNEEWRSMSRRSREMITGYSPESFAIGLSNAANYAVKMSRRRIPIKARIVLSVLGLRKGTAA